MDTMKVVVTSVQISSIQHFVLLGAVAFLACTHFNPLDGDTIHITINKDQAIEILHKKVEMMHLTINATLLVLI